MSFFSKLNINMKLAGLALLLGVIAVIIGNPAGSSQITMDTNQVTTLLQNKSDLIDPQDIAKWIIEQRLDYILIDLRPVEKYDEYHIPGAMSKGINNLVDAGLPRNEKIILYSDDDVATAQAWILLNGLKYPYVFRVDGGLAGWEKNVRNPDIDSTASKEEMELFAKRKVIARYFGGTPTMNGKAIEEGESELKISKPVMQASGNVPTKKKKMKKEGC